MAANEGGRISGSGLPHKGAVNALANGCHAAGDLVAQNHGVFEDRGAGDAATYIGQIRPADPTPFDADQDLLRSRCRLRQLIDPQVIFAMHNYCKQASP